MSNKRNPNEFVQNSPPEKFYPFYILSTIMPTTALIVASLVIAIINWQSNCGGKMMPLPIWLLVYAIVQFLYLSNSGVAVYFR